MKPGFLRRCRTGIRERAGIADFGHELSGIGCSAQAFSHAPISYPIGRNAPISADWGTPYRQNRR
jgi:hypothetical protein